MTRGTLWKGSVHFGDISVEVKLHAAVREERIQFHLLHRPDGVRLHQQMICAYEKKPVPPEEQIKGYELEGTGKYIIVDPEELAPADPESSRIIEVHEFVRAGQLDPLFFGRAYNLEADGDGYGELLEAMRETGVAGICTWTMRKRSYLGALLPGGKMLRLCALRYGDEVIAANSLELQEIAVSEKEVRIGRDLIGQLTAPFAPQKFEDEHQKKLHRLIEKKARGEEAGLPRPRLLEPTSPEKLLEALEASLRKVA
ncbi:hypothetical protein EPN96_01170 [bacterium]|nr:MAG: hypothetical protein EPN96_01170 [bacterium]